MKRRRRFFCFFVEVELVEVRARSGAHECLASRSHLSQKAFRARSSLLPCALISIRHRKSNAAHFETKPVDTLQVQAPSVDAELREARLEERHRHPFFVFFFFFFLEMVSLFAFFFPCFSIVSRRTLQKQVPAPAPLSLARFPIYNRNKKRGDLWYKISKKLVVYRHPHFTLRRTPPPPARKAPRPSTLPSSPLRPSPARRTCHPGPSPRGRREGNRCPQGRRWRGAAWAGRGPRRPG